MQAAIIAGGFVTRLLPLTADRPKALVDVCGRPFIDYQLALLRRGGVSDVVLCVGHLGEQIEDHVGDGSGFGVRVRYLDEGEAAVSAPSRCWATGSSSPTATATCRLTTLQPPRGSSRAGRPR